jgi:tetratricopeptide (TPR) repeat protein
MRPVRLTLIVAAASIFLTESGATPRAEEALVKADSGGIAIGGGVSQSCIGDCSIRPEQFQALIQALQASEQKSKDLSDSQKMIIAGLERDLDLNRKQVEAALAILGENNVSQERLGSRLIEIAERIKALQEQLASTRPGDDAKIAALKAEAQQALDAGELTEADGLLGRIEERQRKALDSLAANAAETIGARGDISLTRLRYRDAASRFTDAAALLRADDGNKERRLSFIRKAADALFRQGDEFGDNAALMSSIDLSDQALAEISRSEEPFVWAMAQNDRGAALESLGERQNGTERLEEAAAAFRQALLERTRDRAPLDWAMTENNLGNVLVSLGERQNETSQLRQAVEVFQQALLEPTLKRAPLQWAATQNSLGAAYLSLGERESGTADLEASTSAFQEALLERTRERAPLDWAMTENNLGVALLSLGERESGTAHLEASVAAFQQALLERTRARLPLDWAMTQNNLGHALEVLGDREQGTASLKGAVNAWNACLEVASSAWPPEWVASVRSASGRAQAKVDRRSSN